MLKEDELEQLNELINTFVSETMISNNEIDLSCLEYTEQLLNIFNENMPNFAVRPYKHKVPLKDSIENALLFLGNLNSEYGKYLLKRLNDETIKFISFKDAIENDMELTSYSTYENGKRSINIVYEENFGDAYTIIHELLHDTNLMLPEDYNEDNFYIYETRDSFTELISFLGTCLAKKYFEKTLKNKKELDIDLSDDYNGLYNKRFEMDFIIKLIKRYAENGFINNYDILNILNNKPEVYILIVKDYLNRILEENDIELFYNERYLTGVIISDYILNTYSNPEKIFLELNEMITAYPVEDIFSYLDLEAILDKNMSLVRLSDDSIKKIEKSFKSQVKKLY